VSTNSHALIKNESADDQDVAGVWIINYWLRVSDDEHLTMGALYYTWFKNVKEKSEDVT